MGHKNVVGGYTACPGEHWESGLKWRDLLMHEVHAAFNAVQECDGDQPMEHYLLFWTMDLPGLPKIGVTRRTTSPISVRPRGSPWKMPCRLVT